MSIPIYQVDAFASRSFAGNPVAADFDEDGDVDKADLVAWQNGYGTVGAAEHHQGDANGDMNVDGTDFLVWQSQFTGNLSLLSASTAVPEPSTGILFIGMLAVAICTRCSLIKRM